MCTRRLFLMVFLFVSTISFSTANADEYPYLTQYNLESHRSVASYVWSVMGDMVILETEERTMRSFGVEEWKREGFPSPAEGDEVTLILDSGNTIIDLTESGGKGGGFFGNEITGVVHQFSRPMKLIILNTEFGELQTFELKDAAATKLNWVRPGKGIILITDGQNRVMDVYRAE